MFLQSSVFLHIRRRSSLANTSTTDGAVCYENKVSIVLELFRDNSQSHSCEEYNLFVRLYNIALICWHFDDEAAKNHESSKIARKLGFKYGRGKVDCIFIPKKCFDAQMRHLARFLIMETVLSGS